MKKWAYLLILFFVFVISRPAYSEILIYNISLTDEKSFLEMGGFSQVYEGRGTQRGYLILDVELVHGTSINNAVQVTYYEVGNKKVYIPITHDFDLQFFWSGGDWPGDSIYWVLTNIHSPNEDETIAMMLSGELGRRKVGLGSGGNRKWIPKKFEGTYFVSAAFSMNNNNIVYKIMQAMSLRLNTKMTKQANRYWYDYEQAGGAGFNYTPFEWAVGGVDQADDIYGIVTAKLELSGYHEPDPNSINIDPWSL